MHMLPKYQWLENTVDENTALKLAQTLDLHVPIARVLVARGVTSQIIANAFLNPDLKTQLGDPLTFPGIQSAAEQLWTTIRNSGEILVFGDFDVDGVAATAVLSTALRRLGGIVDVFFPIRDPEGYGLTFAALERCLRSRLTLPALLVTVDCGINSVAEVAFLNRRGIKVIITDHHTPGPVLPEAAVIVNPLLGASSGAEHLCGAGVAFKVAHALVDLGRTNGWYQGPALGGDLLISTGLATITDVVPLVGENRVLVWNALKYWNRCAGVGLKALLSRASKASVSAPDATTFGFILGPRMNAAGRMDSALIAYELLTTQDRDHAAELAIKLEGFNGVRRGVEDRMLLAARQQSGLNETTKSFSGAAVVVGGEGSHAGVTGWHPGVIGIVAARLSETTGCPAAVVSFDEKGAGRGSVRAGDGYHALDALMAASVTLDGYGGHARAAGFHVKIGAFDHFKLLFCEACAVQAATNVGQCTQAFDGWLTPELLTPDLYHAQQRLGPFGYGNPTPRWGLREITLTTIKPIGLAGAHLQLAFQHNGRTLPRGVWFRHGMDSAKLQNLLGLVDIIFELRENTFRGESSIELLVLDIIPKTR